LKKKLLVCRSKKRRQLITLLKPSSTVMHSKQNTFFRQIGNRWRCAISLHIVDTCFATTN